MAVLDFNLLLQALQLITLAEAEAAVTVRLLTVVAELVAVVTVLPD
jgi:hypothetical protein